MRERWDAVVVGGGPAGAAVAARLSGTGHRVLVLDRESFPRAKPCGECVNPAGVRAMEALGALPALLRAPHEPIHGWRIHPGGSPPFSGHFPTASPGVGVARERLDALLLEHASARGATLRTGSRVVDLLRDGGAVAGVRLSDGEEIRGRLVIGADGLRSVVVRKLALLRRPPRLRKVALTAHVRGVDALDGCGELHAFGWGCVGVAAVGEGEANVTVVLSGGDTGRVAGAREEYFDRVLRGLDRLARARRCSEVRSTGPFDWPTRTAVADGALLVGDAAGYYDPFTGQGIYRALRGAELAAGVADEALRADDLSARKLSPYQRAHRAAFQPGVRLQHAIEAVVSRPPLLRLAASTLRRNSALADALVAVTGDVRSMRSLLWGRG